MWLIRRLRVMTNEKTTTPIVQVPDSSGNRAYALAHWQGVDGKPFTDKDELLMTSPNGTKFKLTVDDDGNLKTEKEETNGDKE